MFHVEGSRINRRSEPSMQSPQKGAPVYLDVQDGKMTAERIRTFMILSNK